MKELKIPVSSRILPDLKEDLEMEAQEAGLTTSLYLEQILQGRHGLFQDDEVDVEVLQAENEQLQVELKEAYARQKEFRLQRNDYREELEQVKSELEDANTAKQVLEEKALSLASLGILDLSSFEITELEGYLSQLEAKYPTYSRSYLLMATFNRMVKNEEGMFIIHTIANY